MEIPLAGLSACFDGSFLYVDPSGYPHCPYFVGGILNIIPARLTSCYMASIIRIGRVILTELETLISPFMSH